MRIFKNAWFERFRRKQKIQDAALREGLTDEQLAVLIQNGQFLEIDDHG